MFEEIFERVVKTVEKHDLKLKTWDKLSVTTLAHVNLMKAQRVVDLLELGIYAPKLEVELLDIIAYSAKIVQKMFVTELKVAE